MRYRIIDADGGTATADLVYSPDDGGYYWQRHSDSAVSVELYASRKAAFDNPPHWEG